MVWIAKATKYLFRSQWFDLRQDQVELPEGEQITYTFVEHPGSVFIVPISTNNNIILIRSYRYPINDWCWEVPAGTLGDTGLAAKQAARAELSQEIGASHADIHEIGSYYFSNGIAKNKGTIFAAMNVRYDTKLQLDSAELIDRVQEFTIAEVEAMLLSGELNDADSGFALQLVISWLKQRG